MARPIGFDPEQALERAMDVFWSRGYQAASIEELVARMGIQRGSLYGTFGDKRALFLRAVDRYQRVVARELFDALEAPGSGLAAIRRFFRLRVESALDRRRPPGCLVTNSTVELSGRDRGAAAKVGGSLVRRPRSAARWSAPARPASSRAAGMCGRSRFLTSSAQGLSVMAKAFPERAILEDVVSVILSTLEPGRPRPRRRRAGNEAP